MIIRPARTEDYDILPDIEIAAAARFAEVGVGLPDPQAAITPETWAWIADGGFVLVAEVDGGPVGMIGIERLERGWYVVELDVHPDYQRRGIGAALLDAAKARTGLLYLTTFRDVSWNGPWYERQGFRELTGAALPAIVAHRLASEAEAGLVGRCAMGWAEAGFGAGGEGPCLACPP